mgnify:CR=1 FL=1
MGILLLAVGGDRLVLGAKGLSSKLQVPPFIIGIFILGFGTSLPELFVTIRALENGNPDIAIGGVLGSNIANIFLVMGILATINQVSVEDFVIKTTPAAILLRKAAGIEKGSATPNSVKVGSVTLQQVQEIAKAKMEDLNANSIEMAMEMIRGTARSMGLEVKG